MHPRTARQPAILHPSVPYLLRRCKCAAERAQEQARGQGGTQWCWSAPPGRGGCCGSRAVEVQPAWCAGSPAAGIGKCAHCSASTVHMHAQPCRLVGLRCRTYHVGGLRRPCACVWVAGTGTAGFNGTCSGRRKCRWLHAQAGAKDGATCCLLSMKQLVRTQTVLLWAMTTI